MSEAVERLSRDLANAAKTLSEKEARYLVDAYYLVQDYRIQATNQARIMTEDGEPVLLLDWLANNTSTLEGQIRRALDKYTDGSPVGAWMKGIIGIGPVLSAGLLANINITRAPTVGHIWSFAGLNPDQKWGKGQRRPFNARLKVICWKIGESFVKVSGNPKSLYGRLYAERKALEESRNSEGLLAPQAASKLEQFKIDKTTDAYKAYSTGKLPPAHLHARAKRYAVKLFLAHLHGMWYEYYYGVPAPKPYVIEHLGHAHEITWKDAA